MEVLGSFTCRKAGTWDRFFHFPSEGRHAEDFSDARKIQRLRPGYDPAPHNHIAHSLRPSSTQPQPAQPVQNTICSNTRSCSPDNGHNDARNMLRYKFDNKHRSRCILLVYLHHTFHDARSQEPKTGRAGFSSSPSLPDRIPTYICTSYS